MPKQSNEHRKQKCSFFQIHPWVVFQKRIHSIRAGSAGDEYFPIEVALMPSLHPSACTTEPHDGGLKSI